MDQKGVYPENDDHQQQDDDEHLVVDELANSDASSSSSENDFLHCYLPIHIELVPTQINTTSEQVKISVPVTTQPPSPPPPPVESSPMLSSSTQPSPMQASLLQPSSTQPSAMQSPSSQRGMPLLEVTSTSIKSKFKVDAQDPRFQAEDKFFEWTGISYPANASGDISFSCGSRVIKTILLDGLPKQASACDQSSWFGCIDHFEHLSNYVQAPFEVVVSTNMTGPVQLYYTCHAHDRYCAATETATGFVVPPSGAFTVFQAETNAITLTLPAPCAITRLLFHTSNHIIQERRTWSVEELQSSKHLVCHTDSLFQLHFELDAKIGGEYPRGYIFILDDGFTAGRYVLHNKPTQINGYAVTESGPSRNVKTNRLTFLNNKSNLQSLPSMNKPAEKYFLV